MKGTRMVLAAFALTVAFAAQAEAQSLRLGVRGGVNFSSFSGEGVDDETTDRRTGPVARRRERPWLILAF